MRELDDVLNRVRQTPLGLLVDELRALHARGDAPAQGVAPASHRADEATRGADAGAATHTGTTPQATTAASSNMDGAARGGAMRPSEPSGALAPVLDLLQRASITATAPLAPAPIARHTPARAGRALPARSPASRGEGRFRGDGGGHDADDGAFLSNAFAAHGHDADQRYATLARHFGEHERELRRHARVTERILDQLARGEIAGVDAAPSPLQQEIRILCPAGGRSAGRFVVRNELGRPALVELRAHLLDPADHSTIEARCVPARLELEIDAEALASVQVELAPHARTHDGQLELVVDARVGDDVVQKVWVVVVAHDALPGGPEDAP